MLMTHMILGFILANYSRLARIRELKLMAVTTAGAPVSIRTAAFIEIFQTTQRCQSSIEFISGH